MQFANLHFIFYPLLPPRSGADERSPADLFFPVSSASSEGRPSQQESEIHNITYTWDIKIQDVKIDFPDPNPNLNLKHETQIENSNLKLSHNPTCKANPNSYT